MKRLSLQEIQSVELNLLKELKRICEKHDLYYTLCGGTLLGAVRHQGFIPWDNDIDVLMPRPDFEKLRELIEGGKICDLPDYMEFTGWNLEHYGPFPFLKLTDFRTMVDDQFSNIDKHIWIDIFPTDGCPDNMAELKKLYGKILRWRNILTLKCAKAGRGKNALKIITKPFVKIILLPFTTKGICRKLDCFARRYNYINANKIGCLAWGYGPQECIDKKKYTEPIQVEFEKIAFNAPGNYIEYLTNLYGDYMTLPPVGERKTRHEINAFLKGEQIINKE